MSYPPQQGYTAPHYGQPQPPGQQQNNLWLIGGTILVVLVIIMTVILLVVQQTVGDDSADGGGSDPSQTEEPEGNDHTDLDPAAEFSSDACDELDFSVFEEAVGESINFEENSYSESSSTNYQSVSCYFYTDDYNSVSINLYDYETPEDVLTYIGYDESSYGTDPDYEFSEYNDYGDAGTLYTKISDPTYQVTYLHVALGSLEVSINASYDATDGGDAGTVAAGLEDVVKQIDVLFGDFT